MCAVLFMAHVVGTATQPASTLLFGSCMMHARHQLMMQHCGPVWRMRLADNTQPWFPPFPGAVCSTHMQALSATNAEMSLLDMSDLPPLQGIPCSPNASSKNTLHEASPGSQPGGPASLAVTQLDLLPPLRGQSRQQQQRPLPRREQPRRPRPHRAQALAVLQEEQAAEGQDGSAEQQEEQPPSGSALGCDVPLGQPGMHQAMGLLPQHTWLNRVLRRLLSAVATSGSSISQLATTGSGTLTGSALSSSGSADSLHSAVSSLESGMERFESCTASDVEEEPEEVLMD